MTKMDPKKKKKLAVAHIREHCRLYCHPCVHTQGDIPHRFCSRQPPAVHCKNNNKAEAQLWKELMESQDLSPV